MNSRQSFLGGILAFVLATSCCWIPWLMLVLGGVAGLSIIEQYLQQYSWLFMGLGAGFLGLGIAKMNKNKNMDGSKKELVLQSKITCPNCGFEQMELMPTNACQYFYDCKNCQALLKPQKGDCCVYCSYGTVPCPPIQLDQKCC